jgi:hypothetical protein
MRAEANASAGGGVAVGRRDLEIARGGRYGGGIGGHVGGQQSDGDGAAGSVGGIEATLLLRN